MEVIAGDARHPSALEIFDRLRPEFPRLSLGNVYRNLGILVEQGRIEALDLGHGVIRYDAARKRHYHFVCKRCGRIYDLPGPEGDDLERALKNLSPHLIEEHNIQLFGVCNNCQKRLKNK